MDDAHAESIEPSPAPDERQNRIFHCVEEDHRRPLETEGFKS
jgi:hypothetical protein